MPTLAINSLTSWSSFLPMIEACVQLRPETSLGFLPSGFDGALFLCRDYFIVVFPIVDSAQILTPWREPPAPEREAFMTFWVTRDAHVHICMDSRTPPNKLPSWLEYAGFRKQPVRVLQ